MATLSTFDGALKTKFIGPIRDQLYSNKILLEGLRTRDASKETNMPKGSRDFKGIVSTSEGIDYVGKTFTMSLHTGRNTGVGYRAEGAKIPGYGAQSYKTISDNLRYIYGQFRLTGQVIELSDKAEGAFAKAMAEEMKRLSDDLKRRVSIGGYGTKDANGNAPVTTITATATSATQALATTVRLQIGDTVDVYNPTGATRRNTNTVLTVVSINRPAKTVTFDQSVAATSADILIWASPDSTTAAPNNDLAQSPNGLGNIIDDTVSLHGIDPTVAGNGFWKSYVKAQGNAVISDTILRDAKDMIGFESGMDDGLIGIWTRGIRNRYVNTLIGLKQFTDANSTTLRGGFKAVLFDDEIPFVIDDHMTPGDLYFLNCDAMFWAQATDFQWLDREGSVLKWDPGYDAFVGIFYKYHQMGTWARNRHAKLTGLQDDTR